MEYTTFKALGQWLLPQTCFLCGDLSVQSLCEDCVKDLPRVSICCKRCGCSTPEQDLCWNCQLDLPVFTETKVVFPYRYPVDILIHAVKFENNFAILALLGKLMATHLIIEKKPDVLIPVPLHANRLRERGYNQALALAKSIAKQHAIPLSNKACIRWRDTPPQYTLSGNQRKINLQGAFKLGHIESHWQHVAIVDDVMTTGTTACEITTMLLQAGIQRVDVWCCTRA